MRENKNNRTETLVVAPGEGGLRLDVFCASRIGALSRNQVQKINRQGGILVDSEMRPAHYHLSEGERVSIELPAPPDADEAPVAQDIDINVLYEDDAIMVINKDAGIVVHPAHGNREGTLVNAILGRGARLSTLGGKERPGIVHRLDKDTSGVMVVAKSDAAYSGLSDQIKARRFEKIYHAIVWGNLGIRRRTIDAPIARHPVHRKKMSVARRGGREAVTEVFVVDTFEHFDYIRVFTLTGRTHQIRVHLSHVSHPILGDEVYGGRRKKGISSNARVRSRISALLNIAKRQALHASRLSFAHPVTGDWLVFNTVLPDDMRLALEMLHCDNRTMEVAR